MSSRTPSPARLALALVLLALLSGEGLAQASKAQKRANRAASIDRVLAGAGNEVGGLRRRMRLNGRELFIVATDSGFSIPESTTEGSQYVRLVERVKAERRGRHAVFIARVPLGESLEEVKRAVAAGRIESLALSFIGGPGLPDATGRSVIQAEFRPGSYVIGAATVGEDGTRTFSPGSVGLLNVIKIAKGNLPDLQPASADVKLREGKIELSRSVPAGNAILRIENVSSRPRGLVVRRLEPGATKEEAVRWLAKKKGTRPFTYVQSVTPLSPGRTLVMFFPLEPGDYLLSSDVPGVHGRSDGSTAVVSVK